MVGNLGLLVDGKAGPCMGLCMGGGAWHGAWAGVWVMVMLLWWGGGFFNIWVSKISDINKYYYDSKYYTGD